MSQEIEPRTPGREFTILETIACAVPGVAGYLKKEKARDSDQRYRMFLTDRLAGIKTSLETLKRSRVDESVLEGLDRLERLCRKLDRAMDSLRYAARGYSGMFDGVKVREPELKRLEGYDHMLAGLISSIHIASGKLIAGTGAFGDVRSGVQSMEDMLEELIHAIGQRRQVLEHFE
ncbi:hypothetical protein JXA40_02390 [bacterium]|nr:hypothetical protein [candidate division CSSED10-310 bacterium]